MAAFISTVRHTKYLFSAMAGVFFGTCAAS